MAKLRNILMWSDFSNLAVFWRVTVFLRLIFHLVQDHLSQHIPEQSHYWGTSTPLIRIKIKHDFEINLFLLLAALVEVPVVIWLTKLSSSDVDGVAPADSRTTMIRDLLTLIFKRVKSYLTALTECWLQRPWRSSVQRGGCWKLSAEPFSLHLCTWEPSICHTYDMGVLGVWKSVSQIETKFVKILAPHPDPIYKVASLPDFLDEFDILEV